MLGKWKDDLFDGHITILSDHISRRPFQNLQDLYKMRHQAAWGPGYVVADKDKAWRSFQGAWRQSDGLSVDPVVEILSERFVRVNLGPYKQRRYDDGDLFNAWLAGTTTRADGDFEMQASYEALLKGIQTERIHFDAAEIELFEAEVRRLGYPPLAHSEVYIEQYRPHYRVVLRAVLNIPLDT